MQVYWLLFAGILGLVVSLVVAPIVIKLSKKFKLGQTILHYVDLHKQKEGTPTMGGFIFLLGFIVSSVCFFQVDCVLAVVALATTLSFALLGFLDDFIKIKYHQNEGLKPYQKIIGQVGISTIIALFVYFGDFVGTEIIVPFFNISVDIGWGVIPLIIFLLIAITNSVNLTDGLDGLAGGVGMMSLLGFVLLAVVFSSTYPLNSQLFNEQYNLIICACALIGGIVGFLVFNCNKAKIFMGDTGSLALGGFIGAFSIFTRLELFLPIIGIMFVLSAVSDIIQVLHYKRTKRRVFLMAPLHHHFEKKGVHENRIVVIYIVITMLISALTLALTLLLRG